MRSKNKMTKAEIISWIESIIESQYQGNKSDAARDMGASPAELFEVLGGRRNPTSKIFKHLGYKKCPNISYVRIES